MRLDNTVVNAILLPCMKAKIFLFTALLLCAALTLPVIAQAVASPEAVKKTANKVKFKDMADNHWASSSVYDLVKMGITKGYPDGTFRGNKPITRYETAVFLSKLAKAISAEDLKNDIKAMRDDIVLLKKDRKEGFLFSGSYQANWLIGNLLSEKAGNQAAIANYRLVLTGNENLGEGATVKINLDTMDYGYLNDGTDPNGGLLATDLLDLESRIKMDFTGLGFDNPVDLKLTFGPGPKQHLADPTGSLSSEVGVTYIRPYTGIRVSTLLWGADFSGGLYSLGKDLSGKVSVSQLTGSVGIDLPNVPVINALRVELTGDYVASKEDHDLRAGVAMAAQMSEKIKASGKLGMGSSKISGWMASGQIDMNDIWETGTVATIRVAKVGSEFIDPDFAANEFDFAGYDNFSRPLESGTVNVGGKIVQNVSQELRLTGKGDIRLSNDYKFEAPKGRMTAEGGISYTIAPNTNLEAAYRVHHDKGLDDTSDITAFGLMYSF